MGKFDEAIRWQKRAIAAQGGGIVSASNTRVERVEGQDQERTIADLTIQVRSDALDSALSSLRGTLTSTRTCATCRRAKRPFCA